MRVILDCDTKNEIDDQFAIAYALGAEDLDVLGIVSVQNTVASGPTSVDIYVEEARRMAALCGRPEVPCLAGARSPMETPNSAVGSEGLDFIVEQALAGPLTLLATGPITDVAAVALEHPDAASNIHVVWAGAFPDLATWNKHRLGELNARADIAAWRALYASDIRLTVLPGWPHIARVAIDWREYSASLQQLRSPAAGYLGEILHDWCTEKAAIWGVERMPSTKVLWDVVNVAMMRNPAWVTSLIQDLPSLDAAGAPDYSRPSREAEVCTDLDSDAILADLWEVLAALPG